MSYTALYRKFRPDHFDDVKGQEPIVTTLRNQVRMGRTGHAYLFCGTRGTGKTTMAKILAKTVNCENPKDGNPCNQCRICRAINEGSSMNVIEIDAASNNGVDNIREIVEEVRYSPTEGKYKVYIVDEVHMLSSGAFNALLKTLEEPPPYVMFILATTEVHKIPITILSRCQRYDFKRITVEVIVARLKELMDKEGLLAEEKALFYIARMADGAMRDALSLLDQCVAFYPEKVLTYDDVLEVLGSVDVEIFARLLRYIRKGAAAECVRLLDEIIVAGRELVQFMVDYTWYLRNLLLLKASKETEELLEVSADQLALLRHEAKATEAQTLLRQIRIFSELSNQIKYASQKRILTEVAFIKLCRPEMEADYASLAERIRRMEERMESGELYAAARKEAEPSGREKPEPVPESLPPQEPGKAADKESAGQVASKWKAVLAALPQMLRTVLISAHLSVEGGRLILLFDHKVDKQLIDENGRVEEIKRAAEAVTGQKIELSTRLSKEEPQEGGSPNLELLKKKIPVEYVEE